MLTTREVGSLSTPEIGATLLQRPLAGPAEEKNHAGRTFCVAMGARGGGWIGNPDGTAVVSGKSIRDFLVDDGRTPVMSGGKIEQLAQKSPHSETLSGSFTVERTEQTEKEDRRISFWVGVLQNDFELSPGLVCKSLLHSVYQSPFGFSSALCLAGPPYSLLFLYPFSKRLT